MGSSIKIQMDGGFVRSEILRNTEIIIPVSNKTKGIKEENKVDGAELFITTKDEESQVLIEEENGEIKATFTYPIDSDKKTGNGRVYMIDEFVFSLKDKTLGKYWRHFDSVEPQGSSFWADLGEKLEGDADRTLKLPKEDPRVQKFFKNVVLKLPRPAPKEEEPAPPPLPPPVLSEPREDSPLLLNLSSLSPPTTVEEAHGRRLLTGFPQMAQAFRGIHEGPLLLQRGMASLFENPSRPNPHFEKLLQRCEGKPHLKLVVEGLVHLSRGEWKEAEHFWTAIQGRNPTADFLLHWAQSYEQAAQNLNILQLMRQTFSEETALKQKSESALLGRVSDFFLRAKAPSPKLRQNCAAVFSKAEEKIRKGEADSVQEAFSQLETTAASEEKEVFALFQSKEFAQGVLQDLVSASSLHGHFQNLSLLAAAYEKMVPNHLLASSSTLFQGFAKGTYGSNYAGLGRNALLALSGQGNLADELHWTTPQAFHQLVDPLTVGTFVIGGAASRLGQSYVYGRFGGLGFKTNLLASAAGVFAEAPAFELAHQGFHYAFIDNQPGQGIGPGTVRNWMTFGALRGSSLGLRWSSDYLVKNNILPFGRFTVPVVTQGGSFAALHGMNELEIGLDLRSPSGSWVPRLMMDGAFFLQAGAVAPIGESVHPHLSRFVQSHERTNDFFQKFPVALKKIPVAKGPITYTGRTIWVRIESSVEADGTDIPEQYYALEPGKPAWVIGRLASSSHGKIDVPLPPGDIQLSRQHAQIYLNHEGQPMIAPLGPTSKVGGVRDRFKNNDDEWVELVKYVRFHPLSETSALRETQILQRDGSENPRVFVDQPFPIVRGDRILIGDSRVLKFDVPKPPKSRVTPMPAPPSKVLHEKEPTTTAIVLGPPNSLREIDPNHVTILEPGKFLLGVDNNEPGRPRVAQHSAFIPGFGEAFAFTDAGVCKKNLRDPSLPPVNEDAYGISLDGEGRPLFKVGDGMGGHGHGAEASQQSVLTVVEKASKDGTKSLGELFLDADQAIIQDNINRHEAWVRSGKIGNEPQDAATVAGAVRLHPDRSLEVALVGDIRFWIYRLQPDGSYEVSEPYFPDHYAGTFREVGNFKNTLEMLATDMPSASNVMAGLGQRSQTLTLVGERMPGGYGQVLQTILSFKDANGVRVPYFFKPGDGLLLATDGPIGQFNRAQIAELFRGKIGAEAKGRAFYEETRRRQNDFLQVRQSGQTQRVPLAAGGFMQVKPNGTVGKIYASPDLKDQTLIGVAGADNLGAILFEFNPFLRLKRDSPSPADPATSPPGSVNRDSDPTLKIVNPPLHNK